MKLNNKFAIGCLVQWYEIEMIEEYFQSLKLALENIENKENVIVDICFYLSENLEILDKSKISMADILNTLLLFLIYTP